MHEMGEWMEQKSQNFNFFLCMIERDKVRKDVYNDSMFFSMFFFKEKQRKGVFFTSIYRN